MECLWNVYGMSMAYGISMGFLRDSYGFSMGFLVSLLQEELDQLLADLGAGGKNVTRGRDVQQEIPEVLFLTYLPIFFCFDIGYNVGED